MAAPVSGKPVGATIDVYGGGERPAVGGEAKTLAGGGDACYDVGVARLVGPCNGSVWIVGEWRGHWFNPCKPRL